MISISWTIAVLQKYEAFSIHSMKLMTLQGRKWRVGNSHPEVGRLEGAAGHYCLPTQILEATYAPALK